MLGLVRSGGRLILLVAQWTPTRRVTSRSHSAPGRRRALTVSVQNALAPDITTVAISNDAECGLTFRVSIPSHPGLAEDLRIRISLEWDDNAATVLSVEDRRGVDRFILVDRGLYGLGVAGLGSCSGTSCASSVDPAL
jgi:hypothetical protein